MIPYSAPAPTPAHVWLAYPRNTNDPVADPDIGKIIVRGIEPKKPNSPVISIFSSPLPMGAPQIGTSPFPSPFATSANVRTLYRVVDVGTSAAPHLSAKELAWLVKIIENGYWDKRLDHLWFSTLVDQRPLTVIDDGGYDFSKPAGSEPVYRIIGEDCGLKFARSEALDPFFVGPPQTSCTNDPLYENRSGGGPRSSASRALLSRLRALLAASSSAR